MRSKLCRVYSHGKKFLKIHLNCIKLLNMAVKYLIIVKSN